MRVYRNNPISAKLLLGLLMLLGSMTSCHQSAQKMVQHPHLLPGLWKNAGNISVYEEWSISNDSTLTGRAYSVNGSDTLVVETMELSLRQGLWTFWAEPVAQYNGRAVPFVKNDYPDAMVFENPEHDNPNRIIYRLEADSLLYVRIENFAGNKSKEFSFIKISCTRI